MNFMASIDNMANAALAMDALKLRSLTADWLEENKIIANVKAPASTDPTIRAIAAGLVEMLAERRGEAAPAWTSKIDAAPRPVLLVRAALTMRRLRHLCEIESPLPLRKRNLFAPPTYLQSA
jgi:hypothetical protein